MAHIFASVLIFSASTAWATLTVQDPADVIPPSEWVADNALVADYNVPFISYQPTDIKSAYVFEGNHTSLNHETFTVDKNDTSVILVADGGSLSLNDAKVVKYGYSSNLLWASFYGFNAAINVANGSTASLKDINITVHNGGANVYAYGTDTVVKVSDAWLYSSGPVSHGLYASGNGTIEAYNVQHFSGGERSSSFSGDSPKGTVRVYNSYARSAGIGSATYYALGTIYAENVVSISEKGPVVFMDSNQNATLVHCDATAGLLGGVAIFSSSIRSSGAKLELQHTKITTLGSTVPGLWFGNTIINVILDHTQLITDSGILVVANYSQITQDFDYYASYSDNNDLQPAEVFANVIESDLTGNLVAYNGSSITWRLESHSTWTGATVLDVDAGLSPAAFDIALDANSRWILTATSTVQNFTSHDYALSNIQSSGFNVNYNATALQNGWLKSKTIALPGGGYAIPY